MSLLLMFHLHNIDAQSFIFPYQQPFIFNEIVSLETWDNVLSDKDRERLTEFLPTFAEDDEKEKRETLK